MKLGIFSDIHSNDVAFRVCLNYISKHPMDGIVFLGDNVSDCPNPQETLEMIRQLDKSYITWHVKGNREEYFIEHAEGMKEEWNYSSYQGSLLYTYEHLTQEDIETFRQYPKNQVILIPGTLPIRMVHGSTKSSRELLYPGRENTNQCLDELKEDYLLCGHTHKQYSYEHKGKLLINPGSVGVAMGGKAVANFAVLEWSGLRWEWEFMGLPYDLDELREKFKTSSLMKKAYIWPKCILKSLETGVNLGPLCAKAAFDLAVKEGVSVRERNIPERFWEAAAKNMGII